MSRSLHRGKVRYAGVRLLADDASERHDAICERTIDEALQISYRHNIGSSHDPNLNTVDPGSTRGASRPG